MTAAALIRIAFFTFAALALVFVARHIWEDLK